MDDQIIRDVRDTNDKITANLDLIPISSWGFDTTIMNKLRNQKHSAANNLLSKSEKMQLSNNKKQYIARGTGTIRNNVSEVMTWMAEDSQLSVMKPKNGHIKPDAKVKAENGSAREKQIETSKAFQQKVSTKEPKAKIHKVENAISPNENETKPEDVVKVGDIAYSALNFSTAPVEKKKLTKMESRNKFAGKDYQRLLKKVEKRNERLDNIREKDPEKAKNIEQHIQWERVMNRAKGQKVKDNVDLLKKGLKSKMKQKIKSKKMWKERTKKVKKFQNKKQERRDANIEKRKVGKKDRKAKKGK
ncbi:surfeit locus protein 6 domain-containing protein [Ditylenchus destructor]|uniref:Surfeit locus protein 6 domain-containing protein n=1 Tax=Ditylenchus destructor TaxID=166010 RepID=A0AAD4N4K7_9BILA|nr:surfeit locus protein 6 domain-containing protein [Ditylenchus destructor]